jgi:hypothetical protein
MHTGGERRSGNTLCGSATKDGAPCRDIARWRCRSCQELLCIGHIVRKPDGPTCPNCKEQLKPLMRRAAHQWKRTA